MPTLESLKQSILTECDEDHVGLWSVVRDVAEAAPEAGPKPPFGIQVLRLLHELLLARDIKAGFPTPKGRFRTFAHAPEKIMEQIKAEWPVGHRPTIGEGLWFTRAKKRTATRSESYGPLVLHLATKTARRGFRSGNWLAPGRGPGRGPPGHRRRTGRGRRRAVRRNGAERVKETCGAEKGHSTFMCQRSVKVG